MNTLKDNQSLDLLVLKELITRMTGSEALEDVSESQAQAMAGGDVLRSEAINFNNATPPKARAKGIARLRDALQRGAKGGDPLTVPLLVLIAQCRQAIIFKTDSNHLKLVSQLYDSCQETFFHYCDFLQTAFDVDEYAAMLPSLETLVHEYGLEPGAAFHVYRPILRRLKPRPAPAKDDPSKDRDAAVALDVGGKEVSWGELLRVVRGMLPDEVWGAISPELYLTFWSLSLYDLHVPTARYDAEIDRRRKEIDVLEGPHQNQRGGDGNGSGAGAEATRRRKERERLAALVDSLERERDAQEREVAAVSKRLAREKDRFLADLPRRNETAAAIAQHCVLPRCVFSHADAVYCARFVERLNALDTPWFSTVTYFNQIFWIQQQLVFSCTEYEAGRLGKFMRENFALLHSWKADEATYEKECHAVCGFNLKLNDPGAGKVSYAEYVKLVYKWHVRSCKFYLACLEDKEYMSIRNVLAVLSKLVEFYPAIARTGNLMMREAARIKEKDERGDLQTVANRYLAMLQREKAKWRADNVFNPYLPPDPKEVAAREVKPKADGEREKAAEKGEGGGGGARRGGRGGKDAAKLSVTAQEFTPTKSNAKDESGGGGGKRGGGGGGGGGGRVGKDDAEPEKVREREPDRSRDRDRVARGGDRDRPRDDGKAVGGGGGGGGGRDRGGDKRRREDDNAGDKDAKRRRSDGRGGGRDSSRDAGLRGVGGGGDVRRRRRRPRRRQGPRRRRPRRRSRTRRASATRPTLMYARARANGPR